MIALLEARRAGLLTRAHLMPNLVAGLVVGIVAMPLAMAFAIASGATPAQGLYTAIVAGLVTAMFGGTRVQISGPTGAFIAVLAGITAQFGIAGLQAATVMAGFILLVMGLARLGNVIKFIPSPVIAGFTVGIAVIIWVGQWKDFFGLHPAASGLHFHEKFIAVLRELPHLHYATTLIAALTLAILIVGNRPFARVPLLKRVPTPLLAMLAAMGVQAYGQFAGVATIGSAFGGIPRALPGFSWPAISFSDLLQLIGPAFAIALLGAIESLLTAVVADGMTGARHDSNQELIGQGAANIIAPLFGGFAATGAIARTATNIRSGARTPLAGMIHAVVLLGIVLVAAPLAASIPMTVLAAILLVVAYNMGEWREIPELWRQGWTDRVVWMVTFALTVLADLTVAVEAGMILAALLFIRRVSSTTTVSRVTRDYVERGRAHTLQDKPIPDYITIFRIHGPFLFGATDKLTDFIPRAQELTPIVVLRLRNMTAIDATGLRAIQDFADALHRNGRTLLLCGALAQPARLMSQSDFHRYIGAENILPNVEAALKRADEIWRERQAPAHPAHV
jgi:SulP family sulfate permease